MRHCTAPFRSALLVSGVAALAACAPLRVGDGLPEKAADGAQPASLVAPPMLSASAAVPGAIPSVAVTATSAAMPAAAPAAMPAATPAAGPVAAIPAARAASAAAAAAAAPGAPPAFAAVIKDAQRIEGPLTLWQKDDKVWIELLPAQFGQPFLLLPKIKSGIGQAWVLGGLMAFPVNGAGGVQVVEFQRLHNQVRLLARNTEVAARPGTPQARALADSYSQSLLGAVAVASQPHPERLSVLVEANGLFLNDMLGIGMLLQRGLRQGYGLDRSNTLITAVRGSPQATVIETQNHYYSGNIATPSAGAPPGAPVPVVPRFVPDSRSLLVSLNYSLAPLPETPMPTRRADPRLGLFSTTVLDFSDDLQLSPRRRYIERWRLAKKDPAAGLSEPVRPITFWIDRNVPLEYRETVRSAILEWNLAFEKLGLRNAITVEQQSDDAAFETLDFGHASVRWMMNAEPSFAAIGPTQVDPRTGEILDAAIAFEGIEARRVRSLRAQVLAAPSAAGATFAAAAATGTDIDAASGMPLALERCMHGELAAEQLGYALDVLEARGELDPDSPLARQFVLDYIKETIMHEVGHALGLRHNFRASRVYTEAQLSDPEFTRANGTTGSVMEYNAVNLPRPGHTGGVPFQTALGPYDYWAIEYAYKTMPAGTTPDAEEAELQRIAARSSEPLLAFGTDEDNYFGLDPETMQLDLGSDPVAFAAKRLEIARDLFQRQETRELSPQHDYSVLRRSLGFAIADVTRAVGVLARQIGGVRTLRDFPGSGRDPLQPVPAQVQRESLDLLARAVLAADGLHLTPALQRRLAPDFLDRADAGGGAPDFALPQRLLELQRSVLAYLMSDGLAARVLDSMGKFDRASDAFQLSELYRRLGDDVWSELGHDAAISPERRELQRDYISRVAAALLRPSPQARADARGLVRAQARGLLARLEAAQRRILGRSGAAARLSAPRGTAGAAAASSHAGADPEAGVHLSESIDTLHQALAASIQRQAL